jgi:hypothetical protein
MCTQPGASFPDTRGSLDVPLRTTQGTNETRLACLAASNKEGRLAECSCTYMYQLRCCIVLRCVALCRFGCCIMLRCVALHRYVYQLRCCIVLRCVALCRSGCCVVLHCVALFKFVFLFRVSPFLCVFSFLFCVSAHGAQCTVRNQGSGASTSGPTRMVSTLQLARTLCTLCWRGWQIPLSHARGPS